MEQFVSLIILYFITLYWLHCLLTSQSLARYLQTFVIFEACGFPEVSVALVEGNLALSWMQGGMAEQASHGAL
jgi:nitrate reductase NapE component